MFSKRHYVALAAVIRRVEVSPDPMARLTPEDFADLFARDNPRFDRARFLAACGVGEAR